MSFNSNSRQFFTHGTRNRKRRKRNATLARCRATRLTVGQPGPIIAYIRSVSFGSHACAAATHQFGDRKVRKKPKTTAATTATSQIEKRAEILQWSLGKAKSDQVRAQNLRLTARRKIDDCSALLLAVRSCQLPACSLQSTVSSWQLAVLFCFGSLCNLTALCLPHLHADLSLAFYQIIANASARRASPHSRHRIARGAFLARSLLLLRLLHCWPSFCCLFFAYAFKAT